MKVLQFTVRIQSSEGSKYWGGGGKGEGGWRDGGWGSEKGISWVNVTVKGSNSAMEAWE